MSHERALRQQRDEDWRNAIEMPAVRRCCPQIPAGKGRGNRRHLQAWTSTENVLAIRRRAGQGSWQLRHKSLQPWVRHCSMPRPIHRMPDQRS